jgi:hypothetical protein
MGKNDWKRKDEESQDAPKEQSQEMTMEEARAYRASLYKAEEVELTDAQKRDEFRKFWAQQKYKYGKSKDLEPILWAHLKATKQDDPAKFEDGVAHFGLKKIQ